MTVYDDADAKLRAAESAITDTQGFIAANEVVLGDLKQDMDAALGYVQDAQDLLLERTPMQLVSGLFVEGAHSPVPQVKNTICNVHWKDIQPVKGGPLVHPNEIDNWLDKGGVGHVRVFFGRYAPQYAFTAAGQVYLSDPQDGLNGIAIPKWWTQAYLELAADFVSKLAAAYDGKISLVFMASPMTIYAEPMMRGSDRGKSLTGSGYTIALDEAAFQAQLQIFSSFKRTRLGMAFNPLQTANPDGTNGQAVTFTLSYMDQFRSMFGERAHVQNNSVRIPALGGDYAKMYAHMKGMKPSGYQLATEPRVGDYAKATQWCIDQGAHSVELSPNFQNHLSAAQLTSFDAALKANAA